MTNQLKYKGYLGAVEFSGEDNILFGKILGIADSISFEGTGIKEINSNFKKAVDDYIKLCEETGKDPLPSLTGTFNVRTTVETHRKLKMLAELHKTKLNAEVNSAFDAWIQNKY